MVLLDFQRKTSNIYLYLRYIYIYIVTRYSYFTVPILFCTFCRYQNTLCTLHDKTTYVQTASNINIIMLYIVSCKYRIISYPKAIILYLFIAYNQCNFLNSLIQCDVLRKDSMIDTVSVAMSAEGGFVTYATNTVPYRQCQYYMSGISSMHGVVSIHGLLSRK